MTPSKWKHLEALLLKETPKLTAGQNNTHHFQRRCNHRLSRRSKRVNPMVEARGSQKESRKRRIRKLHADAATEEQTKVYGLMASTTIDHDQWMTAPRATRDPSHFY